MVTWERKELVRESLSPITKTPWSRLDLGLQRPQWVRLFLPGIARSPCIDNGEGDVTETHWTGSQLSQGLSWAACPQQVT